MPESLVLTLEAQWIWCLLTFLGGLLLGWLVTLLGMRNRYSEQIYRAESESEALRHDIDSMERTFAALSGEALRKNNQAFVELARQTMDAYRNHASQDLQIREKSIANLIQPIQIALQKTERQLQDLESSRRESQGALHNYLETLVGTQQALFHETRNLVKSLRRPEVRGQWGELTLKRLVELAGMAEHCDFVQQLSADGESGLQRPDMVVHLPGRRDIVIDVKTPLDAYLSAIEAGSVPDQQKYLQKHALKVKQRIRELAAKDYWRQFPHSPDFVILFLPGDQFLVAALDVDPDIVEKALKDRIILATPTSLVALLRAIAFGWRQEHLAENSEKIRELGEELYSRIASMLEHFCKLGKSLDTCIDQFNKTVGSLESMVLPSAIKFTQMGINKKKDIPDPAYVDKSSRSVKKPVA